MMVYCQAYVLDNYLAILTLFMHAMQLIVYLFQIFYVPPIIYIYSSSLHQYKPLVKAYAGNISLVQI
jgi:hypothetical protein